MRGITIGYAAIAALLGTRGLIHVIAEDERGDDNYPDAPDSASPDELAYPYFNVHYHYNKHDWNKVLEDQNRLIALRRRVRKMRQQLENDSRRTADFLNKQDVILTDARASLFQRALYNATQPSYARGFKKAPATVHDRLHYMHDEFYQPIPASDFINVNEPYYFGMLASQML
ncbi:uncharacterized protein BBOV_IV011840 [Babesia bovis T2Bo]|uniref:Membrane protein, putative n=1 Tax=Babesia bovis TaxID=5865 RepID=A7ASL7_BABBO|nr:uncharacterized protein BBOV_IV011840 [Babesia bovis T2Bo]EDO07536.1 putative integral membrane protein [Babesia bovis T2Bo]|eukprot:XP_001611104.1 hypothetical protein [Babesia bovis T2Bo]